MNTREHKESLSSTSALVLLWTDHDLYTSQIVKEYWPKLDLSAGMQLFDDCNAVWPNYSSVINNRKWLILNWSQNILARNEIKQVIIFAAGWAPLGLELAAKYHDCNIFELDLDIMEAKTKLIGRMENSPQNIHFISADMTHRSETIDALMAGSWLSAEPTLLILEGISYYIKREDLMAIFDLPCNQSQAILEYMIHYDQVEPSRREIPIKVFETIATECSLELPIETWDIEEIAKSVPGKVLDRVILCDIEKARMKNDKESHRLFPSPRSGWIEIANIEINDSRNHY